MVKTIKVDGMTCQHCVQTVSEAITSLPGVQKVDVNLEDKSVVVVMDEIETGISAVKAKIVEVGFVVVGK